MIKRVTRIAIYLFAAIGEGCVHSPAIPVRPLPATGPVDLALSSPSSLTHSGDLPIIVNVRIENLTRHPIGFATHGIDSTFLLWLYLDGKPVPETAEGASAKAGAGIINRWTDIPDKELNYSIIPYTLPALGSDVYPIDLRRLFQIKKPGTYLLVVEKNIGFNKPVFIETKTKLHIF